MTVNFDMGFQYLCHFQRNAIGNKGFKPNEVLLNKQANISTWNLSCYVH
jgi:hypothetical protein